MLVGNDRITRETRARKRRKKMGQTCEGKFVKIQMSEIAKALTETHDKPF